MEIYSNFSKYSLRLRLWDKPSDIDIIKIMVCKAMVAKLLYPMTYKCNLFVIPTNGGCSEQQVGSYMKQVEHNDYISEYVTNRSL